MDQFIETATGYANLRHVVKIERVGDTNRYALWLVGGLSATVIGDISIRMGALTVSPAPDEA